MIYKYETVSLRTMAGIRKAEKMKASGWKIVSFGFETILFEKPDKEAMKEAYRKHLREIAGLSETPTSNI